MSTGPSFESRWGAVESWWIAMGERVQVPDRAESFSKSRSQDACSIVSGKSAGKSTTCCSS